MFHNILLICRFHNFALYSSYLLNFANKETRKLCDFIIESMRCVHYDDIEKLLRKKVFEYICALGVSKLTLFCNKLRWIAPLTKIYAKNIRKLARCSPPMPYVLHLKGDKYNIWVLHCLELRSVSYFWCVQ